MLRNNWLRANAGHYEPGGHGQLEKRLKHRQHDVELIMRRFPGLWRRVEKATLPDGYPELRMRLRGDSLGKWRAKMRLQRSLF